MNRNRSLFAVSGISVFLVFFGVSSLAQNDNCTPSSCGNITIKYPFRLTTTPESCGYDDPAFELKCQNNRTVVEAESKRYIVQDINYELYTIRLVDPTINRENLSSCPLYSNKIDVFPSIFTSFVYWNIPVSFISCLAPVNSSKYVEGPFCGNRSGVSHSSQTYSYVMVGDEIVVSDLEELCTIYGVLWSSGRRRMSDNSSLAAVYDYMAYGFEISWYMALCECKWRDEYCIVKGGRVICIHECFLGTPLSRLIGNCEVEYMIFMGGQSVLVVIGALVALRFLIGFPILMVLVARKWRRRHLAMDETIEEFLQGQNNLTPIKYTYSQIKKMTNNFNQRLGEGAYGTVYKGQLRSGPYVAVKMMEQSMASEHEFISEVGTIGRIHHVNVVQLIGFSVEGSKCALVYEYLPNGSLDRYIFSQQGLEVTALRYEKMFEIALGVARGIDYLHRGCDMQILHFDIKPHNILLDETFHPKISDLGLPRCTRLVAVS